jgi:hypothetical protein
MLNINRKFVAVFFASMAVLLGAAMIANPIAQVNAQGNQTNATNATAGAAKNATAGAAKNATAGAAKNATAGEKKVVAAVKIDVDPVMKALKDAYPKLGDVKDAKGLVDALKDIKDPKEVVRNMVAAGLLQDLEIFKTIQDMQ